jgi:uncharacterized membrane protein
VSLYVVLKFVHVVFAIIAVGSNATYGLWLARARSAPEHLPYVLKGVKFIDDRMANPSYIMLLITGLALAAIGNIPFTTFWVASGIALLVLVGVVGFAVYTPTLRGEIAALEAGRADSNDFRRLDRRGTVIGITLGVLSLAIVFLMVTKPTL